MKESVLDTSEPIPETIPENIKNSYFEAVLFRNVFHLMYLQ